ncbi:MAG: decaprenyl-phosphate phosphoribosyltransferase [Thermoflavifilum sp.]|nr:decaprenyl-phosphate phosphoribosyltransferase [Thermoflavifilum sp.]
MPIRFIRSGVFPMLMLVLREMRPMQWSKNAFVFAALIFTVPHINAGMIGRCLGCFLLFCLVSGTVYIVNDFMDLPNDMQHPEKRSRPMASGALPTSTALVAASVAAVIALTGAWIFYSGELFLCILGYLILNLGYSIRLKHIAILDICAIAAGFVIRAVAGGVAIGVELTPWFLICALMLSLFLATGKRRHEYVLWNKSGVSSRPVMNQYSLELLNQLSSITATCVILSYALFTLSSQHARPLMVTIPFVIYGVMRYLKIVYTEGAGGKPEVTLVEDKHILVTVVLFAITVVMVLALKD